MPFWVFDVRLRNRALLNNNLKIIFEVSKNWETSPKKNEITCSETSAWRKKGGGFQILLNDVQNVPLL